MLFPLETLSSPLSPPFFQYVHVYVDKYHTCTCSRSCLANQSDFTITQSNMLWCLVRASSLLATKEYSQSLQVQIQYHVHETSSRANNYVLSYFVPSTCI